MNWYREVLKKHTQFAGRAQRAEFWYFTLFNFLITIALVPIYFFLQDSQPGTNAHGPNPKGVTA
jgi:uncharacterized membrane protein YhaH (DUF805 family)